MGKRFERLERLRNTTPQEMADISAATPAAAQKKRRFSTSGVLLQLREVVTRNSYEDGSRWKKVAALVGDPSGRIYAPVTRRL